MTRGCISGRSTRISSAGKNEYGCMIGMKEHIEIQKDAWTHTYSQSPLVYASVCLICHDNKRSDKRKGVCLPFFSLFFHSIYLLFSLSLLFFSLISFATPHSQFILILLPLHFSFSLSLLLLPPCPHSRGMGGGAFIHTTYKSIKTQSLE